MRKLASFPIKYPVTVLMIVLAIVLLGFISFKKLGTELFPDLNNPRIYVEVKAQDRPPEELEKNFIDDMESVIMRSRGVLQVSSVTKVGSSLITIEYNWEQDMDEAFLEIQKALSRYEQNDEIEEVNISRLDPNASPVLLIALQNPNITDMEELRKAAENYIRNEIIRLEGVADVKIAGQVESEIEILTDEFQLKAFNLTPQMISNRLQSLNRNISGGSINEMGKKYIIKGISLVNNIDDIKNIIVTFSTDSSQVNNTEKVPVFLKDVANVKQIDKEPDNIVRVNQQRCLGLYIYKETKYNTVEVVNTLNKALEDIMNSLPGYQFTIVDNQGTFIKAAIDEVKQSALFGIILAVFILYVFLRRIGSTLVISIAMPISIIATFNLMYFNGLTLNIMTLGGLALGAGMLVDNAIVVLENIFRLRDSGKSVTESAIEGTAQVGGAITASTLTTIVVFLPIVYLHGASGELFKDQAWTVAFSLLSSLFVAILLIPVLYNMFYKNKTNKLTVSVITFPRYKKFLEEILDIKGWILAGAILLIGLAVFLVPVIGSEYFPQSTSANFSIKLTLPEGTRLDRTASTTENLEDIIKEIVKDDLVLIYSHIGPTSTSEAEAENFFQDENNASILVKIKPESLDKVNKYISRIDNTIKNNDELEYEIIQEESSLKEILDTDEAPVVVEVKGENNDVTESLAKQVISKLETIDNLYSVESSMQEGAPEIEIRIDRYRAAMNNVDINSIISSVTENLEGNSAGKFEYKGEQKDIIIRYPDKSINDLYNIMINSGNIKIPITDVATIIPTNSPKEIIRKDQNRIIRVSAWIKNVIPIDQITKQVRSTLSTIEVPTNYEINISGEEQKRKDSFGSLSFAMLLSIILVYMVLASQFESLLHPFTILLTIPLAGVGSILLFFILGQSLNVMAYIGIIMLAGIAVNDSIILVDAINQYKNNGYNVRESILNAGQQRIRPIIMTSLTTILALIPLTLGFGESASLRAPMAISVIGGLVTSTLLTLIVIPCVYYAFEKLRFKLLKKEFE